MNTSTMCVAWLVACRRTAGSGISDRRWSVVNTTDRRYYLVQDARGKTLFEGNAHCRYCARADALIKSSANADWLFPLPKP